MQSSCSLRISSIHADCLGHKNLPDIVQNPTLAKQNSAQSIQLISCHSSPIFFCFFYHYSYSYCCSKNKTTAHYPHNYSLLQKECCLGRTQETTLLAVPAMAPLRVFARPAVGPAQRTSHQSHGRYQARPHRPSASQPQPRPKLTSRIAIRPSQPDCAHAGDQLLLALAP
jgi:hypothetical protein